MKFSNFKACKDDDERRLDRVLKRILSSKKDAEKGNIFRLIRKNLIHLNGSKTSPSVRVKEGDIISVASFLLCSKDEKEKGEKVEGEREKNIEKKDVKIKTVFKNQHVWIVNKDSGISVQPEKKEKVCLLSFISSQTKNSSLSFRVGPLHRIDKSVTGLTVFSQSLEGAKWFSQNLKKRTIKKIYLAVVENSFPPKPVTFNSPIGGKEAKTIVNLISSCELEGGEKVSLLKVEIITGRKHQIRLHLSSSGYPILGDRRFGSKINNLRGTLFLHAWKLFFPFPNEIGLPPEVSAEIPESFMKIFGSVLKKS